MMRYLLILLLWLGASLSASAQQRLALVIGNSAYDADAGGYLANPGRDADTIATALRGVGFDVDVRKNLDENGIERAIRDHRNRLREAGADALSFFYYAGHGANDSERNFGGSNYMIPVGASIRSIDDLAIDGVELADAIDSFASAAVSFVVFDACRNFPFAVSERRSAVRGFKPEPSVRGTLIAFSSEPGTTALDDSGYANALATALNTPGLHHVDIFRKVRTEVRKRTNGDQFAWYRDGVDGDIVFKAGLAAPAPSFNAESVLWDELQGSCSGLQAYVDRYPSGRFASTARARLNQSPCVEEPDQSNATIAIPTPARSPYEAARAGYFAQQRGDFESAAREYRIACDGGNAVGCTNLGNLYQAGNGVAKSDTEAVSVYRKGCDGGDADGCTGVGVMYQLGRGVKKSATQARTFYRRACDGGSMTGCNNLGLMYRTGSGIPQSYDQAALVFRKACDGGIALSCAHIGFMYWNGYGVTKSKAEAIRYSQKACDGGEKTGCENLKLFQGN